MKRQPSAARHANAFLTISPLNLPTEQQNVSCYYNVNTEGDILTFPPPPRHFNGTFAASTGGTLILLFSTEKSHNHTLFNGQG